MRATFDFAAHTTLFLNGRIAGDDLLSRTTVRTITDSATSQVLDLLSFLQRLRAEQVHVLRFIPLAPGDTQGLRTSWKIDAVAAAVAENGRTVLLSPPHALSLAHLGVEPALNLVDAGRLLHQSLDEAITLLRGDRRLIVERPDGMDRPLELPPGYSPTARRLATTASTALAIVELARERGVERDRSAAQARELLAVVERNARGALASVIASWTLESQARASG